MLGPDLANIGFQVEASKKKVDKLQRPVFFGENGVPTLRYEIDAYHPDFRDTMAIDLRIRKITEALGYSFKTYEEEERLYQDIAKEADLQGWEVDRLLYEYTDRFLSAIAATEREKQPNRAAGFGQGSGDIELTERLDHEN